MLPFIFFKQDTVVQCITIKVLDFVHLFKKKGVLNLHNVKKDNSFRLCLFGFRINVNKQQHS